MRKVTGDLHDATLLLHGDGPRRHRRGTGLRCGSCGAGERQGTAADQGRRGHRRAVHFRRWPSFATPCRTRRTTWRNCLLGPGRPMKTWPGSGLMPPRPGRAALSSGGEDLVTPTRPTTSSEVTSAGRQVDAGGAAEVLAAAAWWSSSATCNLMPTRWGWARAGPRAGPQGIDVFVVSFPTRCPTRCGRPGGRRVGCACCPGPPGCRPRCHRRCAQRQQARGSCGSGGCRRGARHRPPQIQHVVRHGELR